LIDPFTDMKSRTYLTPVAGRGDIGGI